MYRKTLFVILCLWLWKLTPSVAQTGFEQLIKVGPADATRLVEAYGKPLLKGLGLGMNSGWAHSAQTLKPLRFDIKVTGTAVVVPADDRTFDVTGIGLSSNIRPADPGKVFTPSFSGSTDIYGPEMTVFDANNNELISFELPPGVLESFVPTPQVQVTMGLPGNTDVTVRVAPKIRLGKHFGSVSLIGLGLKHNIIRDFVPAENEVPFDLALGIGYSRLSYKKSLKVLPIEGSVPQDAGQPDDFTSQELFGDFDNYMFQVLLSKQFSILTPYASLGYNISSTRLGLRGNYPIVDGISDDNKIVYKNYTDPIAIERTFMQDFRFDAGLQIRLPILRIFASYGFAQGYRMINAGVGIGI